MKTLFLIITMLFLTFNNPLAFDSNTEINGQIELFMQESINFQEPTLKDVKAKVEKIIYYKSGESMAVVSITFKVSSGESRYRTFYVKVEHTVKDSKGHFSITNLSRMTDNDFRKNPGLNRALSLATRN